MITLHLLPQGNGGSVAVRSWMVLPMRIVATATDRATMADGNRLSLKAIAVQPETVAVRSGIIIALKMLPPVAESTAISARPLALKMMPAPVDVLRIGARLRIQLLPSPAAVVHTPVMPQDAKPLALWHCDNGGTNAVIGSPSLTLTNVNNVPGGKWGNALSFITRAAGSMMQYATASLTPIAAALKPDYTINLWVSLDAAGLTGAIIRIQDSGNLDVMMLYVIGTGDIRVQCRDSLGGLSYAQTASGVLTPGGALRHIELSISPARLVRLFVDGVLMASVTPGAALNQPAKLTLSDTALFSSTSFVGLIDEVRLINGVMHDANFTPPVIPYA